jgi:hypothetical protein
MGRTARYRRASSVWRGNRVSLPPGYAIYDNDGPLWVRIGDITPEIARQMEVSRYNQEARFGTQDAYLRDRKTRRKARLERQR